MQKIRIALVEDSQADLILLKKALEETGKVVVVSTYMNGADVVNTLNEQPQDIDVMVLDYRMPLLNGLETFRNLYLRFPKFKMLLVSHGYYSPVMQEMISMGNQNYCRKNVDVIVQSLQRIMEGRNIYDDYTPIANWEGLTKVGALQLKDESYWRSLLSPLDKKIIIHICNGCSSSNIAIKLGYETSSIEKYRGYILRILGLRNSQQLASWAFANGLVTSTILFHHEFSNVVTDDSTDFGLAKMFLLTGEDGKKRTKTTKKTKRSKK
jgi:DNA-binding NarL/FixJ family response regulator